VETEIVVLTLTESELKYWKKKSKPKQKTNPAHP